MATINGQAASLHLPTSKSMSNRALIMQAIAPGLQVQGLSQAHDTQVLQQLLAGWRAGASHLHTGDAGTAMRFGLALLALQGWQGSLLGSARMHQRPIGGLVHALQQLGCSIGYLQAEGYPPLQLAGYSPSGRQRVEVQAGHSSQFATALMLCSPLLPLGTQLVVQGLTSAPYFHLTQVMMEQAGAEIAQDGDTFQLLKPYAQGTLLMEGDWTAASYFFSLVALQPPGYRLLLANLWAPGSSPQGDSVLPQWFEPLGLRCQHSAQGLLLHKVHSQLPHQLSIDFTDSPDLAQTLLVACAALGVGLHATGLHTLYAKETDRVQAMATELARLGARLAPAPRGQLQLLPSTLHPLAPGQAIATYGDHRMAMAFAPLLCRFPLAFAQPQVVAKSFPHFWEAMAQLGLQPAHA